MQPIPTPALHAVLHCACTSVPPKSKGCMCLCMQSKVQPDCGGLTQGCSQHSLTNGTQAAAAPPHRSAVAAGSAGARSAQERRHEAGSAGTSGHKKQAATACYAAGGMEEGAQQGGESGDCGSCGGDSNSACGCSSQDGARKCQQAEGSQNPLPCAHNGAHGAIPCAGTQGAECAAGGESICASSGGGSDMNVVVGVSEHGQGGGKGVKREARGMEKSAMEASCAAAAALLGADCGAEWGGQQRMRVCPQDVIVGCGVGWTVTYERVPTVMLLSALGLGCEAAAVLQPRCLWRARVGEAAALVQDCHAEWCGAVLLCNWGVWTAAHLVGIAGVLWTCVMCA
eukprot:1156365-Pelagomonas_calceolata.AAC.10